MLATPTGELRVYPTGAFLRARGLGPKDRAVRGTLLVENVSPVPGRVRVRAVAPERDVDGVIRVRVRGEGRTLFSGTLGELRRWSRGSVTLSPLEGTTLQVKVSVPPRARDSFVGRTGDATVLFSFAEERP